MSNNLPTFPLPGTPQLETLSADKAEAVLQLNTMSTYVQTSEGYVEAMKQRRQALLAAFRTAFGEDMGDGRKIVGAKTGLRIMGPTVQRTGATGA